MSYEHGRAALDLDMPPRVPRTEYSAESHWDLVSAVTGIDVGPFSGDEIKNTAQRRFIRAWDYDFIWSVLISGGEFGESRSRMGHGVYAQAGVDFDGDTSRLIDDPEDVYGFDFDGVLGIAEKDVLTERFDTHYRGNVSAAPDAVNMTGVYITCMSGLIDLLGWDMLLLSAGTDPRRFGEFTDRYANWIERYFIALAESAAPVVMIHDDIVWTEGAFIHPDWYRKYIFPNYSRLFGHLNRAGKKIMFTSDGDYTEFIDDIAGCGVNGFALEPLTDLAYIAERYKTTHSFIGNADTNVLLRGSREDIYSEVQRCMDIGKKCPGFFMAVGNHIPSNTPVDNALYYNETYEKLSRR